jgi:hypothetical protein
MYMWLIEFDGLEVQVENEVDAVLVFDEVVPGDRGVYSCFVSNDVGNVTSNQVILSIDGELRVCVISNLGWSIEMWLIKTQYIGRRSPLAILPFHENSDKDRWRVFWQWMKLSLVCPSFPFLVLIILCWATFSVQEVRETISMSSWLATTWLAVHTKLSVTTYSVLSEDCNLHAAQVPSMQPLLNFVFDALSTQQHKVSHQWVHVGIVVDLFLSIVCPHLVL